MIGWIGVSCALLCLKWALVLLSFVGLICFILRFRVLLLSMVICRAFFLYLVGFLKVVLYLLCCMFWFLAVNIRANPAITGLSLPGVPAPLSPITQYADVDSDRSIRAVFDTYSLFEKSSGAKLNLPKFKGLWFGSWLGRQDPPVSLDWTSNKIKVLGVFISAGNMDEDNLSLIHI